VDGAIHNEDANIERDTVRDRYLTDHGLYVYRVPAAEVYRNADAVADGVWLLAEERIRGRR
ncbi:MAG: DUF559 domain-containing protein, partial [Asticcacaulis sp.]